MEINNPDDVNFFDQELQLETFAICKSDLYIKNSNGRHADNIKSRNTLSNDQHFDKNKLLYYWANN